MVKRSVFNLVLFLSLILFLSPLTIAGYWDTYNAAQVGGGGGGSSPPYSDAGINTTILNVNQTLWDRDAIINTTLWNYLFGLKNYSDAGINSTIQNVNTTLWNRMLTDNSYLAHRNESNSFNQTQTFVNYNPNAGEQIIQNLTFSGINTGSDFTGKYISQDIYFYYYNAPGGLAAPYLAAQRIYANFTNKGSVFVPNLRVIDATIYTGPNVLMTNPPLSYQVETMGLSTFSNGVMNVKASVNGSQAIALRTDCLGYATSGECVGYRGFAQDLSLGGAKLSGVEGVCSTIGSTVYCKAFNARPKLFGAISWDRSMTFFGDKGSIMNQGGNMYLLNQSQVSKNAPTELQSFIPHWSVNSTDGHFFMNGNLHVRNNTWIDENLTIGDGVKQTNITMTSPDGTEYNCGVANGGTWMCS